MHRVVVPYSRAAAIFIKSVKTYKNINFFIWTPFSALFISTHASWRLLQLHCWPFWISRNAFSFSFFINNGLYIFISKNENIVLQKNRNQETEPIGLGMGLIFLKLNFVGLSLVLCQNQLMFTPTWFTSCLHVFFHMVSNCYSIHDCWFDVCSRWC